MQDETIGLTADPWLRRFREYVTATLAGIICLGTVVLVGIAFTSVGDPDTFNRAKDLLLFLNPIVGVVIGYYFTKVSTEGRAESAEANAQAASANAQRALNARATAEADARFATQTAEAATKAREQVEAEKERVRSTMSELVEASSAMLPAAAGAARGPGVLSVAGEGPTDGEAEQHLREALGQARRVLERTA